MAMPVAVYMILKDLSCCSVQREHSVSLNATLSYVWGTRQVSALNEATIPTHYREGVYGNASVIRLPKTIRQTIDLVKLLGYRYLWVDSLCILQDNPREADSQIQMMDVIYGNSSLTICAAGPDADFGLPGALPASRKIKQHIERCGELDLLVVRRVESYIQNSTWNTRAWTFQERLLSNRCLLFVAGRVFFQCRQATWSEDLDAESNVPGWTLDMIASPLTVFKENPLRRYSTCVKLYSRRVLSYYQDKLRAFDGLGKVLSIELNATLHYGLPDSYFDWALLWEANVYAKVHPPGTWVERSDFPSWSWCSLKIGVEWRFSTIAGILVNVHEWLTQHTWIVWYKGNPTGNEQNSHVLVWEPGEHQRNPPTRWDGYSTVHNAEPYGRSSTSEAVQRIVELTTIPSSPPKEGCLHFWTYSAYFKLSRKKHVTRQIQITTRRWPSSFWHLRHKK